MSHRIEMLQDELNRLTEDRDTWKLLAGQWESACNTAMSQRDEMMVLKADSPIPVWNLQELLRKSEDAKLGCQSELASLREENGRLKATLGESLDWIAETTHVPDFEGLEEFMARAEALSPSPEGEAPKKPLGVTTWGGTFGPCTIARMALEANPGHEFEATRDIKQGEECTFEMAPGENPTADLVMVPIKPSDDLVESVMEEMEGVGKSLWDKVLDSLSLRYSHLAGILRDHAKFVADGPFLTLTGLPLHCIFVDAAINHPDQRCVNDKRGQDALLKAIQGRVGGTAEMMISYVPSLTGNERSALYGEMLDVLRKTVKFSNLTANYHCDVASLIQRAEACHE